MAFFAKSARACVFFSTLMAAAFVTGCASSPDQKPATEMEAASPSLSSDIPSGTHLDAVLATPGLFPLQGEIDFGNKNALAAPPALLRVTPESLPNSVKTKTTDCWILAAGYGYSEPDSVRYSTDLFFCASPSGKTVFEARFTGAVGSESVGLGAPGIAGAYAAPAVYRAIGLFAQALPKILPTSLAQSSYTQALFAIAKTKASLYRRFGDSKLTLVGIDAGAPVSVLTLEDSSLQETPLDPPK